MMTDGERDIWNEMQRDAVDDRCPFCGRKWESCSGHAPGDGDPRDGSGRASQGE